MLERDGDLPSSDNVPSWSRALKIVSRCNLISYHRNNAESIDVDWLRTVLKGNLQSPKCIRYRLRIFAELLSMSFIHSVIIRRVRPVGWGMRLKLRSWVLGFYSVIIRWTVWAGSAKNGVKENLFGSLTVWLSKWSVVLCWTRLKISAIFHLLNHTSHRLQVTNHSSENVNVRWLSYSVWFVNMLLCTRSYV